jgi:hypothetical protein
MAEDLELKIDDDEGQKPIEVVIEDDKPLEGNAPVEEKEPEIDPGTASLKAQLDAANARAADLQRERDEHVTLATRAKTEVVDSQHQLILNTIENVKSKGDQLEAQLEAAQNEGDNKKAAALFRQLAKVEADLNQLDNARMSVEAQQKAPKVAPVEGRVRAAPVDPVEALAGQLSPKSAAWVRAHPDCATDDSLFHEMIAADKRALRAGFKADTPEYFSFIEKRLGFTKEEEPVIETTRRVAAPVSRDVPSIAGSPSTRGTVIRLSPEQQEQARYEGMTYKEYAEHLVAAKREERERMN